MKRLLFLFLILFPILIHGQVDGIYKYFQKNGNEYIVKEKHGVVYEKFSTYDKWDRLTNQLNVISAVVFEKTDIYGYTRVSFKFQGSEEEQSFKIRNIKLVKDDDSGSLSFGAYVKDGNGSYVGWNRKMFGFRGNENSMIFENDQITLR